MNYRKWYYPKIYFALVFYVTLLCNVKCYLVERLEEGDKIFDAPFSTCKGYMTEHVRWSSRYCECGENQTFYSLQPGVNKCYHDFGKNIGCNLAFKDSPKGGVKGFVQNGDYPGQYLGRFTKDCKFSKSFFEIWDEFNGWKKINFMNAKWAYGVYISWLKANYTRDIVGKLFRLNFKCSRKQNNCVLFKGLGKELPLPPTTTLPTTKPPTTKLPTTKLTTKIPSIKSPTAKEPTKKVSTTILPTIILPSSKQPSTTIKKQTTNSQITIISSPDKSSYILGALLGVTLFILIVIVIVILLYVWFQRKYKNENMSILDWFQDRFKRNRSSRQFDNNNGNNDNIYASVEKMHQIPPRVSTKPRPQLSILSNNSSTMNPKNQASNITSSRKFLHNGIHQRGSPSLINPQNYAPKVISSRKPLHNDNIYLTPIDAKNGQKATLQNTNKGNNHQKANPSNQKNFYDSVAEGTSGRNIVENHYTITDEQVNDNKSFKQPNRTDSDIYAKLQIQNEKLPELPEKYSCLGDVNTMLDDDYCPLDVLPSNERNNNRTSCQSEHVYFETEPHV